MSKRNLLAVLENEEVLKNPAIKRAFNLIDRKDFLPNDYPGDFYINAPIAIGYGQTNSQPFTVAFMLDLLEVAEGQIVLDIGSGSGWTTALLTYLVGKKGDVTGIERIKELAEFGQNNLKKYHFDNTKIIAAKAGELGIPSQKFDRILVSADCTNEIPQALLDQLKINGIMVIPSGDSIFKIHKTSEKELVKKEFRGFRFVPLIVDR